MCITSFNYLPHQASYNNELPICSKWYHQSLRLKILEIFPYCFLASYSMCNTSVNPMGSPVKLCSESDLSTLALAVWFSVIGRTTGYQRCLCPNLWNLWVGEVTWQRIIQVVHRMKIANQYILIGECSSGILGWVHKYPLYTKERDKKVRTRKIAVWERLLLTWLALKIQE